MFAGLFVKLLPLLLIGAEGRTRTGTGYPTRPSNVRVYQFRHFGLFPDSNIDGVEAY
jgi:hypothetical protein